MLGSRAQAGQAYAFDTPPLVTPQPAYLQPQFAGGYGRGGEQGRGRDCVAPGGGGGDAMCAQMCMQPDSSPLGVPLLPVQP